MQTCNSSGSAWGTCSGCNSQSDTGVVAKDIGVGKNDTGNTIQDSGAGGKSKTLSVPKGGVTWFDTGKNVTSGDNVSISATGKVDIGGSYGEASDPSGWSPAKGNKGFILPDASRFSLIGAIGNVKYDPGQYPTKTTYFSIGSSKTFTSTKSGKLYLAVNDDMPWDNTGSFNVTVKINSSSDSFVVMGHSGMWTDTGIDITPGNTVEFSASGKVDIGGSYGETSDPKGWSPSSGNKGFILPSAPRFSLIGAIGNVKYDPSQYPTKTTYFAIGGSKSMKATTSGRLYLSVNDDVPWDNTGSFTVKVTVK